jgi:hypothetical protein
VADALAQDVARGWREAMLAGDWEAAWRQTDRVEALRRAAQRQTGFVREPGHLVWDGSSFAGRCVLVRCEHGLGDTLQFSRFLPALCRQASELQVMAQPQLVELLRGLPGAGEVKDGWCGPDAWPPCDVEIEVMELAYALRATPATIPPPLPFARNARSTVDLAGEGGLRIGLLWAASDWDTTRTIPLQAFEPLLGLPGLRFFSLQQGPAADDPLLATLPVQPLSHHTRDIATAAGAMLQMDAVVCVDGMPAHLAGSLAVPTLLLLKHDADWRWGRGARTPWYPSMRLLRQQAAGDWGFVIAAARRVLQELAATAETLHG